MKRMVTEEEIAEIASQSSKPLYRYNGSLAIVFDDEEAEESYGARIIFDFISADKGEGLEDENYVVALKEIVRLAFFGRKSVIYMGVANSGTISTHNCLAIYIQSTVNAEGQYSAGIYLSDNFFEFCPNATYQELLNKFLDAESYIVTRTNLQTGEQYVREV